MGMASYTSSIFDNEPEEASPSEGNDIRTRRDYSRMRTDISIPDELFVSPRGQGEVLRILQNQINDQLALTQKNMYMTSSQSSLNQRQPTFIAGSGGGAGSAGFHGGAGGGGISGIARGDHSFALGRQHSASENPMGMSQWMDHGKRYGYWEHFKEEVVREFKEIQAHDMGWDKKLPTPTIEGPEDKVSVDGKIDIGDKVSIKKHEPIIIK